MTPRLTKCVWFSAYGLVRMVAQKYCSICTYAYLQLIYTPQVLLVMDYVAGGAILESARLQPHDRLTEEAARKYMRDVLLVCGLVLHHTCGGKRVHCRACT